MRTRNVRTHTHTLVAAAFLTVITGIAAYAQAPAAPPQTPPAQAQPPAQSPTQPVEQPAAAAALPAAGYTYDPAGRRDPFLSLMGRGTDPASMAVRPQGLPGLLIGEITVKGIVRDRAGFIAMLQGPDSKTFIVRAGERLMDGTVKSITQDTIVFSQDVNDPLSLVKQREIRKTVRSGDPNRG
jgi:type IV pilus assembly protein PilP